MTNTNRGTPALEATLGGVSVWPIAQGIALLVCAIIFLLTAFLDVPTNYGDLGIITVCALVLLWRESQRSIGAILIFSTATLYLLPTISLIYVHQQVTVAIFALFAIVAFLMTRFGLSAEHLPVTPPVAARPAGGVGELAATAAILIAGLVLAYFSGVGGQPVFIGATALALVHLERAHWAKASRAVHWAGLAVFTIAVGIYAAVLWDGFGRIVLISLVLMSVFLAARYRLFRLNPLLLAGGGAVLVFAGRVLRFGIGEGIAGIADDSGASHLIISSELLAGGFGNTSGTTLSEQIQLYFFNWVPRAVWPAKPLGINSLFVDSYIGRSGYSDDFSTAIGFFGEQIYFAGWYWMLTTAATVAMVVIVRLLVIRVARPYYAATVVFDVWLLTLFWGGLASAAARTWFGLVPLVLYVLVLNARSRRMAPATAREARWA